MSDKKKSIWDRVGELMLKSQTTSPTSVTGGDAYGARAMQAFSEGDVEKAKEIQREEDAKATMAMGTAALIPEMAVTGVVPTLVTTAAGLAGGYGGNMLGSRIDEKYNTKWAAPVLSIIGGLGSGIGSYKGLVNAGTKGLLKGNNMMYGKNFVSDVVATSLNKATKVPYKQTYGLVKWYGPTMGKTTASKTNPNLVDFDDYIRPDLETLALKHGMNKQQLMMSQDPAIREEARQVMLKSIDGWKQNPNNASKTLVVSKSDIIQDPIYNNTPTVLKQEEFLRRNAARGETDINNSLDWYNSTRKKGGNALLEWPDEQGVYISDIEPYVPDPHQITFTPKLSSRSTASYKFYERPSTYFKDAKYPASSKSYGGKEVPAWQLPKGERNQPYNATATERVFSVLGRDSKIKTKGVSEIELRNGSDELYNYWALYNFLKTHGVDVNNITLDDLKTLYNQRENAISALGEYNITSPLHMGMKHLSWFTRGYDKEGLVGSILTTGDPAHSGSKIEMVRNLTIKGGDRPGFDPPLIVNNSRTKVHNVSPRMYDAGIVVAKQTGNGRGIISGNMLAHPEITIKKWDMYPDKIVLGNHGQHDWNGELRSGQVVLLPTPRSNAIPTKSVLFYPSVIENGKITTDVNHKSIFKKQGGKLNNKLTK